MRVLRGIVAFLVGAIMAASLVAGHITQPRTVQSFLDVFGDWDPALLYFMVGCVVPYFFINRIVERRGALLSNEVCKVTSTKLDAKLISGSAIFGFGWGMVGVCPGPAFSSMGTGAPTVLVFVAAMAAGVLASDAVLWVASACGRLDPKQLEGNTTSADRPFAAPRFAPTRQSRRSLRPTKQQYTPGSNQTPC